MDALTEAIDIIKELLQCGEHEGACDNTDNEHDACSIHLKTFTIRQLRAKEFLTRMKAS